MFARRTDVANVGGQDAVFWDQNININTSDDYCVDNEDVDG